MRFTHVSLRATLAFQSTSPLCIEQNIMLYSICLLEICMQMAISDAYIYHISFCFFLSILKSIHAFHSMAKTTFHYINRRNSVMKCRFLNLKGKLNLLTLITSWILIEQ